MKNVKVQNAQQIKKGDLYRIIYRESLHLSLVELIVRAETGVFPLPKEMAGDREGIREGDLVFKARIIIWNGSPSYAQFDIWPSVVSLFTLGLIKDKYQNNEIYLLSELPPELAEENQKLIAFLQNLGALRRVEF